MAAKPSLDNRLKNGPISFAKYCSETRLERTRFPNRQNLFVQTLLTFDAFRVGNDFIWCSVTCRFSVQFEGFQNWIGIIRDSQMCLFSNLTHAFLYQFLIIGVFYISNSPDPPHPSPSHRPHIPHLLPHLLSVRNHVPYGPMWMRQAFHDKYTKNTDCNTWFSIKYLTRSIKQVCALSKWWASFSKDSGYDI